MMTKSCAPTSHEPVGAISKTVVVLNISRYPANRKRDFSRIDKPDILSVVSQFVPLRKVGKNHIALCPLHSEKTPSFTVDPDRQRFKCFGCGEGGDVFTFIKKYHGVDFKGSLNILGLSNNRPYRSDPIQTRKRSLVKSFEEWCWQFGNRLAAEYRLINNALGVFTDTVDMDGLYKRRTVIEYRLDILDGKDDAEKFALYKEVNRG